MDMVRSELGYLGYDATESYGITWKVSSVGPPGRCCLRAGPSPREPGSLMTDLERGMEFHAVVHRAQMKKDGFPNKLCNIIVYYFGSCACYCIRFSL